MERLPLELIQRIIEDVSKPDLHRLANVSQYLRRAALLADYFFLSASITISNSGPRDNGALHYAVLHGMRLSLTLNCKARVPASTLELVAQAVPLLVHFHIRTDPPYCSEILSVARRPAPRLRGFSLEHALFDDENERLCAELFAGSAPRLHSVYFRMTSFPAKPLGAFHAVETLSLSYDDKTPYVRIGEQFPSVRRLMVYCFSWEPLGEQEFNIDCRGADNLVHLDLGGGIADWSSHSDVWRRLLIDSLQLTTFSVLYFGEIRESHPLLKPLSGPLAVRMKLQDGLTIAVRALDVAKQIAVNIQFENYVLDSFAKNLGHRIVDLQLDTPYLKLIEGVHAVTLPALTTLRIDSFDGRSFFKISSEGSCVKCDSLQVIVIVPTDPNSVQPSLFADLARLLGQDLRPLCDRARLEIIGKEYSDDVVASARDIFSSVVVKSRDECARPTVDVPDFTSFEICGRPVRQG